MSKEIETKLPVEQPRLVVPSIGDQFYEGVEWLACWLLDNCEGEEIAEEQLRPWAARAWEARVSRHNEKSQESGSIIHSLRHDEPKWWGGPPPETPIPDAPHDGTHILAHDGSMFPPEVVHWHLDAWYRSNWPIDEENEYHPVKWWPLRDWQNAIAVAPPTQDSNEESK